MIAFLCDGDQMWKWMTGTMDGDKASLSSPDGATLTASMSDGTVTGQVSAPGMPDKAFVAHPAAADEGMFRATTNHDGADYTLGWIMTADGVRGGSNGRPTDRAPVPSPSTGTTTRWTTGSVSGGRNAGNSWTARK